MILPAILAMWSTALGQSPAAPPTLPPAPYFADATPNPPTWAIVTRAVRQDQGAWDIRYRIRNVTSVARTIRPADVELSTDGWLSNSSLPGHSIARRSTTKIMGGSGPTGFADLFASPDDSLRCYEWAALWIAPETADATHDWTERPGEPKGFDTLAIAPGGTVAVRLRLEHRHQIYGDYDPLLGRRDVVLSLGGPPIVDHLAADREEYHAMPSSDWSSIPADHRDDRWFFSAPDSLLLDAEIPGQGYYRFPEIPCRYSTKMRMSFKYFKLNGGDGAFKVRLAQYQQLPSSWKPLANGAWEGEFSVVGKWTEVVRVFFTEDRANTIALDFRLSNSDLGQVYIDDVSLEPYPKPLTNGRP